jgi:phage baseplate assembly protein W
MEIAFPFHISKEGLIANVSFEEHIRQMIRQLIFTAPAERVNRPDFGCALDRLVFAAAGSEVITAARSMLQSQLHRWLGDVIQVETVDIQIEESTLLVTIRYILLRSGTRRVEVFKR